MAIDPGGRVYPFRLAVLVEHRVALPVNEGDRRDAGIDAGAGPVLSGRRVDEGVHRHVAEEVLERDGRLWLGGGGLSRLAPRTAIRVVMMTSCLKPATDRLVTVLPGIGHLGRELARAPRRLTRRVPRGEHLARVRVSQVEPAHDATDHPVGVRVTGLALNRGVDLAEIRAGSHEPGRCCMVRPRNRSGVEVADDHAVTAKDWAFPSANILFSTVHPTLASRCCGSNPFARRLPPRIRLYRRFLSEIGAVLVGFHG